MMFNYPFFSFKNRYYPYRYYNYPSYKNKFSNSYVNIPINQETKTNSNTSSHEYTSSYKPSNSEKCDKKYTFTDNNFFSILGIKLYFDDLIILALLFFLYNEGVKDDGLFICLILLLLS